MMEKVKLTQEQADAIEDLLKERTAESIVKEKANPLLGGGVYIDKSNHIIFTETELDTLIRALYIGYEVEPEFKVGDWVINYGSGSIGKIEDIVLIKGVEHFDGRWSSGTVMCCLEDAFKRHATPEEIAEEKERRWWAEHNRDVWELRFDDVLIHEEKQELIRVVDVQFTGAVIVFINNGYRESLNISYIKQLYSVVCFAEDRKDVKE